MTGSKSVAGTALRVTDLGRRAPRPVTLAPDDERRAALAAELGLNALPALRLDGTLSPVDRRDWRFDGRVTATVVQPCVVTLAPVTSRIDEPVTRRFLAGWTAPAGDEVEIGEDVDVEPLEREIDLGALMVEAVALALPPWPRAEGADLGEAVFAAPGAEPLRDADLKPFAGLAALRDQLADPEPPDDAPRHRGPDPKPR